MTQRLAALRQNCTPARLAETFLLATLLAGGALASTHRWKRRRHAEDGSLAS